jgi:hypothetical protein
MPKKPSVRAPLPDHLPLDTIVHDAPCVCPTCGGTKFGRIGADERDVLEYVASHFKRGREISRDVIARLKKLDLIAAGPRAPTPGAPYAYVTTKKFLEAFGLGSLRDLPDIEKLEDAGLLQRPASEGDLEAFWVCAK